MNVSEYKSYFENYNGKYILKKCIHKTEVNRLYYIIVVNRCVPYTEFLEMESYLSSLKYRKSKVEEYFNMYYREGGYCE